MHGSSSQGWAVEQAVVHAALPLGQTGIHRTYELKPSCKRWCSNSKMQSVRVQHQAACILPSEHRWAHLHGLLGPHAASEAAAEQGAWGLEALAAQGVACLWGPEGDLPGGQTELLPAEQRRLHVEPAGLTQEECPHVVGLAKAASSGDDPLGSGPARGVLPEVVPGLLGVVPAGVEWISEEPPREPVPALRPGPWGLIRAGLGLVGDPWGVPGRVAGQLPAPWPFSGDGLRLGLQGGLR